MKFGDQNIIPEDQNVPRSFPGVMFGELRIIFRELRMKFREPRIIFRKPNIIPRNFAPYLES